MGYDWIISNWTSRKTYSKLLSHVLTPYQINNSSIAQKQARIYGYAPEDHFPDVEKEQRATLALARAQRDAAQQPHIALTHNTRQIVEFLKIDSWQATSTAPSLTCSRRSKMVQQWRRLPSLVLTRWCLSSKGLICLIPSLQTLPLELTHSSRS